MTDTTDHQEVLRREAEAKAAEMLAECEAKVLGLVEDIGPEAFKLLQHVLAQAFVAAFEESAFDTYLATVNDLVASVRDARLRDTFPNTVDALGALSEATEEMELAQ
ncbi:hypothetical protein [Timonella senegalensis]|uniref:hypothetical protein n=1 Tax=Timonella senegalensis TaxID=1465825 RepID=UPI002FDDF2FB